MTKAEMMAEEWWIRGAVCAALRYGRTSDKYDGALFSDKGHEMLKALIHAVAERTRERFIEEALLVFGDDVDTETWDDIADAATWEEEEI